VERITRHNQAAASAASRIGMALLVSAALHLLLVVRVEVGGPRPDDSPPSIRARLELAPAPATSSPSPIRTPVRTSPTSVPAEGVPPAIEQPSLAPQPEPGMAVDAPAEPPAEPDALRVPVDPVFYAARELDVYPVPLEPLRAPAALETRGWVRVLAMVDETGSVTQAEIFDSEPPAVLDGAALAAVRAARFTPARKDGRAVRSRVLIELAFEAQK
jgi:protein TonB